MLLHWVASKNEVVQKMETDPEYQELVLDARGCEDCLDCRKREEQKNSSTFTVMNEHFGLQSSIFYPYGAKFLSGAKMLS